jgi:hypothetical protein
LISILNNLKLNRDITAEAAEEMIEEKRNQENQAGGAPVTVQIKGGPLPLPDAAG